MLHAAHSLLRVALDRQAGAADQPLLARIGEVFRTITGGVQAGVKIEDARDGQTMVALEADGITRKLLDQLSEGTSDQLYLALRIAALEDYAAAASPLPFIADDVLQTFDDPRTTATMRALVGLERHGAGDRPHASSAHCPTGGGFSGLRGERHSVGRLIAPGGIRLTDRSVIYTNGALLQFRHGYARPSHPSRHFGGLDERADRPVSTRAQITLRPAAEAGRAASGHTAPSRGAATRRCAC